MRKSSHRRSTCERRATHARLLLCLLSVGIMVAPLIVVAQPASASLFGNPGFVGFITDDGRFFVQWGYSQFGYINYVKNGSDIYASALALNLTAITRYNYTAQVHVYAVGAKTPIYNASVGVPGYGTVILNAPLPVTHSYVQYRVQVDGTSAFFYAESPYNFLTFTALTDGGSDLAVFMAFGIFLLYSLPLMVKGENMTRRAIYAHRSQAIMWLHGIFFGLVAFYFVDFPAINAAFKGWEFIVIPIPEAIFLFFWAAGRHSQNNKAMFIQIIASEPGERLAIDYREYYVGRVAGGLAIMRGGRGPLQWLYRALGHHVLVFRRSEGKPAPFPLSAIGRDEAALQDQESDPYHLPRGSKVDPHDDFPVPDVSSHIWTEQNEQIRRFYFVKRASDLDKTTWPELSIHKEVWVEPYTTTRKDPASGQAELAVVEGHYETKLCWPYIKDGKCDVELWSWHKMAVLAQHAGYITVDDLTDVAESLAIQLATERGKRYTLANDLANQRTLGEDYIRTLARRHLTDLEQRDYTPPSRARHRPELGDGSGETSPG